MTKCFECRKAENCFGESQNYEYKLVCKADEQFLKDLGALGTLTCKRNFRRPFFVLDLPNKTHVKGVIGDGVIKASFPADRFTECKSDFEKILERLITLRCSDGGQQT